MKGIKYFLTGYFLIYLFFIAVLMLYSIIPLILGDVDYLSELWKNIDYIYVLNITNGCGILFGAAYWLTNKKENVK
jgi:hypothetical protein